MKKIKVFILLMLCFSLIGCKDNNQDKSSYPAIYDVLNSITFDTFREKIDNKESFCVYIARPTCSDCEMLDDRLVNETDSNEELKKILYLNISSIHDDKNKWDSFKEKYGIEGTPSFILFQNGEIKDKYGWTKNNNFNYNEFIEWYSKVTKIR